MKKCFRNLIISNLEMGVVLMPGIVSVIICVGSEYIKQRRRQAPYTMKVHQSAQLNIDEVRKFRNILGINFGTNTC